MGGNTFNQKAISKQRLTSQYHKLEHICLVTEYVDSIIVCIYSSILVPNSTLLGFPRLPCLLHPSL